MVTKSLIVRYGEIALKGKNRLQFERLLMKNIKAAMERQGYRAKIRRTTGRIIIEAPEAPMQGSRHALLPNMGSGTNLAKIVAMVPGVVSVSVADRVEDYYAPTYLMGALETMNVQSFCVRTQRVDKRYPKTSPQVSAELGNFIVKKFGWKVDLKSPDFVINVEIIDGHLYFFHETVAGIGGLPVGTQGKLVALISGGLDSPVAAYLMMKRGAEIVALHFAQKKDIQNIVDRLAKIAPVELIVENHARLLAPYARGLQKIGRKKWLCVFCKYAMLKRAEEIAIANNAFGIVTGDSLGQVASQTLANLYIESMATTMPIYRPLIGMDKTEIIDLARKLGTYDLQIPCECPFRPSAVITRGRPEDFKAILKTLEEIK